MHHTWKHKNKTLPFCFLLAQVHDGELPNIKVPERDWHTVYQESLRELILSVQKGNACLQFILFSHTKGFTQFNCGFLHNFIWVLSNPKCKVWHNDFNYATAVGIFMCYSSVKWRKYVLTLKINLEKHIKVLPKVIKTHVEITEKFGKICALKT